MAGPTVRIGSREIDVEQSPLPGRGMHFKFSVNRPEEGQFRLLPARGVRVLGWTLCVLGWPVLILGLFGLFKQFVMFVQNRLMLEDVVTVLVLLSLGFPFAYFGTALLGPRFLFDTTSRELTIRSFGRTRRRPLRDILAVQMINAGLFGSKNSDGDERFVSYQLNLSLDDQSEPRLFLAYNPDLADMEMKAKQLADFLNVPLLAATKPQVESKKASARPQIAIPDPTQHWAKTFKPMPPFDLEAGALGGLRLGDSMEQAEFLGPPDRVEQAAHYVELHYADQGFMLEFHQRGWVELTCLIAAPTDDPPEPSQGFSRLRLSIGIELTPETSDAKVRECFGPPNSEEDYHTAKTLAYDMGRFSMLFEFEPSTGRLLIWSATLKN